MIYVVFLSSITVQHTGVHLILQQLLGSLEDDMLLFSKTMTIDHLETARKKTNFLLLQEKSLQKLRTRAGSLAIPRYAIHASLQRDLFHASALARQLISHQLR